MFASWFRCTVYIMNCVKADQGCFRCIGMPLHSETPRQRRGASAPMERLTRLAISSWRRLSCRNCRVIKIYTAKIGIVENTWVIHHNIYAATPTAIAPPAIATRPVGRGPPTTPPSLPVAFGPLPVSLPVSLPVPVGVDVAVEPGVIPKTVATANLNCSVALNSL